MSTQTWILAGTAIAMMGGGIRAQLTIRELTKAGVFGKRDIERSSISSFAYLLTSCVAVLGANHSDERLKAAGSGLPLFVGIGAFVAALLSAVARG